MQTAVGGGGGGRQTDRDRETHRQTEMINRERERWEL